MIKCYKDSFGTKKWFNSKGQLHRVDGPAVEYIDGYKVWFRKDRVHRLKGPAIEYHDGTRAWYYYGKFIECNSQEDFIKII